MNNLTTWDCPVCSKVEKPRFNTVTEFIHPPLNFKTQQTVYSCNRCNWAYKRVYNYETKTIIDYEITFDEKGNIILTERQRF